MPHRSPAIVPQRVVEPNKEISMHAPLPFAHTPYCMQVQCPLRHNKGEPRR